jgi:nicotinamide mononucleotide adenylyltransferase
MFDLAVIAGKFGAFHKVHQHLVATALRGAHRVVLLLYRNPDYPMMPRAVRA